MWLYSLISANGRPGHFTPEESAPSLGIEMEAGEIPVKVSKL
jgi:hypothetical protein